MKVSISCLLNLHAEGILAHRTIKSLELARKFAEERGVRSELLIVFDRATDETVQYVERSAHVDGAAKIIFTDFGDPGSARNAGIEQATGEYISLFDGDDLVSQNWLFKAHELSACSKRYIVHPEVSVVFGQKRMLFYHPDQEQEDFDYSNLLVENFWTALCFSRRETFLRVPYNPTPADSGFGYEDWHWNCDVMACGYVHKIALGTAHFVRTKEEGSRNENARNKHLMRHSTLFNDFARLTRAKDASLEA